MCQQRSSRQEARGRMDAAYFKMRDKMLPADESQPVKDGLFWEWEEMADEFDREVTGTFLQELAGTSAQAALVEPGPCPFCQSPNTKWLEEEGQQERQSKHGVVVLPRQVARCRPCGRSFSPSGTAVASGRADARDAAGGGAGEPGGGGASV